MTTYYTSDGFSGAFGTTDGYLSGSLDPATWVTPVGTWATTGSQVQTSASTANSIAYIETSQANVRVGITYSTFTSTIGLVFRYVDANNYWRVTGTASGGNLTLTNVNGGSATNTTLSGATVANGDTVEVVANGTAISVWKGSTLLGSTTSSNQSTATKHGLYSNSNTSGRMDSFFVGLPDQVLMAPSQTQTPSFTKAITKATTTLSATNTQTPTRTTGTGHGKTIGPATNTQTPTLSALPGIQTTPTGTESSPTWAIKVVDMQGNVSSTLQFAEVDKVKWTLNQPDEFEFHFPKNAYTRSTLGALVTSGNAISEIQIYRNNYLLTWGPIVQLQSAGKDGAVRANGYGAEWYLNRRFLDDTVANQLSNPDFESGVGSGWTAHGSGISSDTTYYQVGSHSAKFTTFGSYLEQSFWVYGGPIGTTVYTSGWFNITSYSGPPPWFAGLWMGVQDEGGVWQGDDYFPIDGATPRNQWVKTSQLANGPFHLAVPAGRFWKFTVRVFGINGTIYWDDIRSTRSFSMNSEPPNTPEDPSTLIPRIIMNVQSGNKSDVNIRGSVATQGYKVSKVYLYVDHIQFDQAMREYIERRNGSDYWMDYTANTRTWRMNAGKRGVDRHASITLKYVAGDSTSNCTDYQMTDDAGQCITWQVINSDDNGYDRESGLTTDASQVGGITLQDIRQASQGTQIDSLQYLADERVRRFKTVPATITMNLKLGGATTYLGTMKVGDLVTVLITDGFNNINATYRIQMMELDAKQNLLAVTVAKDDLS